MISLTNIITDEVIYSTLGKCYTELLVEAETSHYSDQRDHGKWLRFQIMDKLRQHARSYH